VPDSFTLLAILFCLNGPAGIATCTTSTAWKVEYLSVPRGCDAIGVVTPGLSKDDAPVIKFVCASKD
jgi:hypothetical protein